MSHYRSVGNITKPNLSSSVWMWKANQCAMAPLLTIGHWSPVAMATHNMFAWPLTTCPGLFIMIKTNCIVDRRQNRNMYDSDCMNKPHGQINTVFIYWAILFFYLVQQLIPSGVQPSGRPSVRVLVSVKEVVVRVVVAQYNNQFSALFCLPCLHKNCIKLKHI